MSTPRQLEIVFSQSSILTLSELDQGSVFAIKDSPGYLYLKTRPVAHILNSKLVQDVISRGDFICVNLTTSNVCILRGDIAVTKYKGKLIVDKETQG